MKSFAVLMLLAGVDAVTNKSSLALQEWLLKKGDHNHLAATEMWANVKCDFECCECVQQVACCPCPCAKDDEGSKVAKETKKAIKDVKKTADKAV